MILGCPVPLPNPPIRVTYSTFVERIEVWEYLGKFFLMEA